jgi:DNA-binding LytR/AlgR family response regulator
LAENVNRRTLRAVIVDDEQLARGFLREMLLGHAEIEIAAECANGFEAVKAIAETSPDLVFLDVQMPKLDGFEVLELIDTGPVVIFVTAYDQYDGSGGGGPRPGGAARENRSQGRHASPCDSS